MSAVLLDRSERGKEEIWWVSIHEFVTENCLDFVLTRCFVTANVTNVLES